MIFSIFLAFAIAVAGVSSTEHSGTCPSLDKNTFGACIVTCTDDSTCKDDEKCCSNGCGQVCTKSCGSPYTCKCAYGTIFYEEEGCRKCRCKEHPCALVDCLPNYICQVNQDTLKPECVQQINRCKTGYELPNIFCGRGPNRQDCPTNYYCEIAPNDAYAVCCPNQVDACSNACKPDETCILQVVQCITTPCNPIPTCIPKK